MPQFMLLARIRIKLLQPYLTLWNAMDCSLPDSYLHGILQAIILGWVAMPSTRESSPPRDWTCISYVYLHWQAGSLPLVPPRKPSCLLHHKEKIHSPFISFTYICPSSKFMSNSTYPWKLPVLWEIIKKCLFGNFMWNNTTDFFKIFTLSGLIHNCCGHFQNSDLIQL